MSKQDLAVQTELYILRKKVIELGHVINGMGHRIHAQRQRIRKQLDYIQALENGPKRAEEAMIAAAKADQVMTELTGIPQEKNVKAH